jgi:DNA-binding transcriptional regulator YdaS (Cro superfamily)
MKIKLDDIFEAAGGQSELAKKLGICKSAVNKWKLKNTVPIGRIVEVEKATAGKITRYQMRPELYK